MGKSQETFSKKEKEKKRLKKRQEKAMKREERKANATGGGLDEMMAYVDEYGNIVDEPVDLTKKKKIKASSIQIGVPRRDDEDFDPVLEGRLAFFKEDKGYGFIKDLNSDEKYFVHINNMMEEIRENDKVNFEIEKGPRGMNAIRVKKWVKKEPKVIEPEAGDEEKGAGEEE